ncbi:MAG: hypothetical protein ACI4JC_06395 [Faecalibacterium sp.]
MEKKIQLPAAYAALSEDEMTYTQGGGSMDILSTASTVIGAAVLGVCYFWGVSQARAWLRDKNNLEGNVLTIMGRAMDDLGADMKVSLPNALRDGAATATYVLLFPVSVVLTVVG